MKIKFIKMQATGNDYIYIDCINQNIDMENIKKYISSMCDRNFGIGSDGVIFIVPSDVATAKMIMFNKDGSESFMCGNGIRSVAKYLYESKLTSDKEFTIETKAGIRKMLLNIEKDIIKNISVNMGHPNFNPMLIPVITEKSFFINENILINDNNYKTTCLSMGNPHAVVFAKNINNIKLNNIGPIFECNYHFPERTNVEFVQKLDDENMKIRIWERGTGETLSCGSGACASVAAGVITGEFKKNTPINVIQNGGTLQVEYNENEGIILTGEAEKVYEGKILLKRKK